MFDPKLTLKKGIHKKYVQEFVDCDYIDKLTESEKQWLALFLQEYYDNSFKEKRLHNDKQKHEIGKINYRRRNDVYAIKKCSGLLTFET